MPTDLPIEYYRQRASAGLILTEATRVNRLAPNISAMRQSRHDEQAARTNASYGSLAGETGMLHQIRSNSDIMVPVILSGFGMFKSKSCLVPKTGASLSCHPSFLCL